MSKVNDTNKTESESNEQISIGNSMMVVGSNVSVTKNTFYNIIKTLSAIIFPLITFPYISRVLQAKNVG